MRGVILNIRDAKGEDKIATLITSDNIKTYYRFYGARHAILKVGNIVDFRVEGEGGSYMPRLRELRLIEFPWILNSDKISIWQEFMQLFFNHLKDREDISSFYYDLILNSSEKWEKQNPKRVIVDTYIQILDEENRVKDLNECYICQQPLNQYISLMRGLRAVHQQCINFPEIDKMKVENYFKTKKSLYLNDNEIDILYKTIMLGF
ncbi:hypothetical protein MNB_SV-9-1464 [hydrothermal vent metagenome]|uniref:DNA replication/recombination mediator RecO N-terminal domain-containing protein n=1 Tax=hydrothermal vent metagenome TaxID=652676 RepID=A0A1W1C710_9ZZZZ